MRQQRGDERQDDGMANQQQAQQRQRDRNRPVVMQWNRDGQQVQDEKGERNSDRGRKDDAHEIRAGRQHLRAAIQPERAIEADQRHGKDESEQRHVRIGDRRLAVELQREHDRREQP